MKVCGFFCGAGLAALLFSGAKGIDFLESTTEYPVFHINPLSLLLTFGLSWLVVFVTFQIMMRRVSRIDASYTCLETESVFREKDRALLIQHGIQLPYDTPLLVSYEAMAEAGASSQ